MVFDRGRLRFHGLDPNGILMDVVQRLATYKLPKLQTTRKYRLHASKICTHLPNAPRTTHD